MLTFNLKKVWFDKIKSGEKTHEYREYKDYWTNRFVRELFHVNKGNNPKKFYKYRTIFLGFLLSKLFFYAENVRSPKIQFMNGMVSEKEKERLYGRLISIKIVDGLKTDLKINAPVYDIEFELIKE